MIKKILCTLLLCTLPCISFAEKIDLTTSRVADVFTKYFPDEVERDAVITYLKYFSLPSWGGHQKQPSGDYGIPEPQLMNFFMDVCYNGAGWDLSKKADAEKCNNFVNEIIYASSSLSTKFYDVCDVGGIFLKEGHPDSTQHCVDNVFYSLVNGIDVQLSQAIELSKEYALVKHNQEVVCNPKPRKYLANDYIQCRSKTKPIFYEFKFDDTNQSTNREIYKDVLRAVGNIHNVPFKNSGCSLERIINTTRCADGYETTDTELCDKINKSLKRFGMESRVKKVSYNLNYSEEYCAAGYISNNCTAAQEYNLDEKMFQYIQHPLTPDLEAYVKDIVFSQLNAKGINPSSFSCNKMPIPEYKSINGIFIQDKASLVCHIDDKCIKFTFEDLSESANYTQNAALSRLACIKQGGQTYGKTCKGLDEKQCTELNNKMKSKGLTFGTHYDRKVGGCVLNGAIAENVVNLSIEIAAGIAITILTSGYGTIPVIVSIGTDLAFEAVNDWQRKIPYKDYQDFLQHIKNCSDRVKSPIEISKLNTVEAKFCLSEVVKDYYTLVIGHLDNLAPEDQKDLITILTNITDNIGIEEFIKKASESEISLFKQGRNYTQHALLAGFLFFNPEKIPSKIDDISTEIIRMRRAISKDFSEILDDFKKTGKNIAPILSNKLSGINLQQINKSLVRDGVEIYEKSGKLLFRNDIESIAKSLKKHPIKEEGFYYLFISENDDIVKIIDSFQQNNYFISAWTDKSGGKFLAISRNNMFKGDHWDNPSTNWLIQSSKNADDVARSLFFKEFPDFKDYDAVFKISNKTYKFQEANALVEKLVRHKDMYFARAVPTKGIGEQFDDYVIVTIKKTDADKLGLSWRNFDFVKNLDNSRFLKNLNYYQNQPITKIGNTPVYIRDFGAIDERAIVTIQVGERKIPFYVSTGLAGKTDVPTGKWEVFFGISPKGWLNKGDLNSIVNHYNSPELKQIANALDNHLGDPRSYQYVLSSIGRQSRPNYSGGFVGGSNAGYISTSTVNSGLKYAPTEAKVTDPAIWKNIRDISDYLRSLR